MTMNSHQLLSSLIIAVVVVFYVSWATMYGGVTAGADVVTRDSAETAVDG
jgi:hypothetical protein